MLKSQRRENRKDNLTSEIEEFKEFLGPLAARYSERELPMLRREMYAMAEILIDSHLENKRRNSTKKYASFDRQSSAA